MKKGNLLILALACAVTMISSPAMAVRNFNSAKSNTSTSVLIYPDSKEDCEASGGNWLVSGRKTFCFVELKVNRDGRQSRACVAAGGTVVTENRYGDPLKGLNVEREKKKEVTTSNVGDYGEVNLPTPPRPIPPPPPSLGIKEYCEPQNGDAFTESLD